MQQWLKAIFFTTLLTITAAAWAQDAAKPATDAAAPNKNNTEHVLRLEGCEFEVTLPGEPYNSRRCDPENPDKCSRITNYTKTFGLDATVNFNITCNPAEEGMFAKYSGEVMKATLTAMVGKDRLEDFKTDMFEGKDFKQAILIGNGKVNEQERMYSAQLWIGQKSVFTAEGEIIGYAGDEADKMFADIVGSVRPIPADAAAQKDGDEDEEEKAEEKTEEKPAAEKDETKKEEAKKP